MIVTGSLGDINDAGFAAATVDWLDIEWYNAHKRRARLQSRAGVEVGLDLDDDAHHNGLSQGDVIYADETGVIAVNILPASCIRVSAGDQESLVRLCYEIGNRHAPFFFADAPGEFLTPADKPILVMLQKLGLEPVECQAQLLPARRIGSAHGHGAHSHEH
jgi:urease accessory protein